MAIQKETLKVRVTFFEEVLGTCANDPEIHDNFIAHNAPDAPSRAEEIEALGTGEVIERGMTVFPRMDDKLTPFIWDYQIKGFFKDSCSALRSVGALMERHGVHFEEADNARMAGKMQYHYRLAFDENGFPMYYVFKNCESYLRTITDLVYSETNVEDVDTECEDHIYDESRYAIMQRVISPRRNVMEDKQIFNPLDVNYDLMRYIMS